jgi:C-terminal processing protease CtpA/Prc
VVKARLDFLTPDGSVLERSKEIDVHLPKIGKGTSTLAKVEIESALADDGVLAQERQPESSPVQPKIPIRSVLTTAANPQTDPAQTHPMSFGSAAPKQVSAGSIPGLGMTVETDLDGGARVVNTTSAGFAESIGFRVGYVITAVNNQPVRTASDLATCQRTIPFE